MNHRILLFRFAVGAALLAIIPRAIIKSDLSAANRWIPVTAILLTFSLLARFIHSLLAGIDAR